MSEDCAATISPSGLREYDPRREWSGGAQLPTVTVVMPVYNESASIDESLASVLSQDYPEGRVEILIADGGSQDGTVERIGRVIAGNPERHIRLLNNPRRTAGAALNLMIREATGEILLRVDGHAEIAPDYVRLCVEALKTTDALNVGGCISTAGSGSWEARSPQRSARSGETEERATAGLPPIEADYVDTVPLGAWRRETFHRLGLFEEWRVNEDCEFNARILDAGGRILLDPGIKATYFSRRSLRSLAQQYFQYGRLKCRVIARHPRQLRLRQVAPPALVLMPLAALLTERLTETARASAPDRVCRIPVHDWDCSPCSPRSELGGRATPWCCQTCLRLCISATEPALSWAPPNSCSSPSSPGSGLLFTCRRERKPEQLRHDSVHRHDWGRRGVTPQERDVRVAEGQRLPIGRGCGSLKREFFSARRGFPRFSL